MQWPIKRSTLLYLVALAGIVVALLPVLWATRMPHIVEADVIVFKNVEFDEKTQQLHLAGMIFDGFHVIYRTSTKLRGDDVIIEMEIAMTRKSYLRQGLSGSFDLNIPLDSNIQRVLFGSEEKVIWQRPQN